MGREIKTTDDLLVDILGYTPSKEERIAILKKLAETGDDIREIASRETLPEMYVPDDKGMYSYHGETLTVDELKTKLTEANPYNRNIIII